MNPGKASDSFCRRTPKRSIALRLIPSRPLLSALASAVASSSGLLYHHQMGAGLLRRDGVLWLLGIACFLLVNLIWELLNQTPPIWDMAHHQLNGLYYLQAWRAGHFFERFAEITDYYPPFYYLQEAAVMALWPGTQFLAFLANLPGVLLLSYCTFRMAEEYRLPYGWLAGLLPLMMPMVAWTSRETLLDVPLSGWVAAGVYVILKSEAFAKPGWSILLGLVFALGMLTKWTFVAFLFFPVLVALIQSRSKLRSALHLFVASLVAAPLTLSWYWPNLQSLLDRFALTASAGTELEKDPGWTSVAGWLYYPRCLLSYYLYLPLAFLFVAAIVILVRRRRLSDLALVWAWLVGGWVLLTLLDAKDPRYIMPLVAPVSLILLAGWSHSKRVVLLVGLVAGLQFLLVSFNVLGRPVAVALLHKQDSDYSSLSREVVFFQTSYFDVAGPPRNQDWRLAELRGAIPPGSRVGFVPDMARFHPGALLLSALQAGRELTVVRVGLGADWPGVLDSCDFVIGKTGAQGISYITDFNAETYARIREKAWVLEGEWSLPDGSVAKLWRNPAKARQAGGHR